LIPNAHGRYLSLKGSGIIKRCTPISSWLYEVPNFDTKKKALSSHKRLKKA